MSDNAFQFFVVERENNHWFVGLPHQCDSWEIAGKNYGDGVKWSEAVELTEQFIEEAKEALQALIERRSYGDEYTFYD